MKEWTKKEKDDKCELCRYVCASNAPGKPWYKCVNQDSENFGKGTGCGCEKYEKSRLGNRDMPLKDALEMIVMLPEGAYNSVHFIQGDETDDGLTRPCWFISFATNKQMLDWRDAHTRLFDELMKLKREAGDFEEGEADNE